MKTFEQLHRAQAGKSSDKWSSYLKVYEKTFQPLRDQPLRLLEIGVQNGGSLEVWSRYFEKARAIIGCDINPLCANLKYEDQRIGVVVGDANTETAYNEIRAFSPEFDVVIDDGSHVSDDILNCFLIYFPLLSPGGTYVIEDTHCLYWDAYQGGIIKQNTAYAFFKLFVDLVNYEHWKSDISIETLFSTFFPKSRVPPILLGGWIDGIEFANSMIVIRKAESPTHSKLGDRLIVGQDAQVMPKTLEIRNALAAQREMGG